MRATVAERVKTQKHSPPCLRSAAERACTASVMASSHLHTTHRTKTTDLWEMTRRKRRTATTTLRTTTTRQAEQRRRTSLRRGLPRKADRLPFLPTHPTQRHQTRRATLVLNRSTATRTVPPVS